MHATTKGYDRKMQRAFLELFRGGYRNDVSSEEDSNEDNFPVDIEQLKRIADMCPKDAFFYSLSPKHLEAITQIVRMFVGRTGTKLDLDSHNRP